VARHFAGNLTARKLADGARTVNTDDRNVLEYGLARTQLGQSGFYYQDLLRAALLGADDVPPHLRAVVNQPLLLEARLQLFASEQELKDSPPGLTGDALNRAEAIAAWASGRYAEVLSLWRGPAVSPADQLMLAISAGRAGTPEQARPLLAAIEVNWPGDAWVAAAWVAYREGAHGQAVGHLEKAFRAMEVNPWVRSKSLESVVDLSALLVTAQPQEAERLLEIWKTPLSVGQLSRSAPIAWYRLSYRLPFVRRLEVLDALGADHPWTREFLEFKKSALEGVGHPLAASAQREWEQLVRDEGRGLLEVLPPPPKPKPVSAVRPSTSPGANTKALTNSQPERIP